MKSKGAIAPPASINLDNVIYFDDLLSQSNLIYHTTFRQINRTTVYVSFDVYIWYLPKILNNFLI